MTDPVQRVPSRVSPSTPAPAPEPSGVPATLKTYIERTEPDTPIRGLVYPVVSDVTPTDELEDLLEVVKTELSVAREDLADVTDRRRKLRDLGLSGTVGVVSYVLVLLKAVGKDWQTQVVSWIGYLLVVAIQLGIPLKLVDSISTEEKLAQADIKKLDRVRLEYESVLRHRKRAEDTPPTIQDDDE